MLSVRNPAHVTLRLRRRMPSLRAPSVRDLFAQVFRQVSRDGFAVVQFSLQADHVHLLVEAEDRARLSSGIRRLVIRAALRLNRLLGRRRGKVWGDRYHRRDLRTPREVRNALVYVLANGKKHGVVPRELPGYDTYASGLWFDGWSLGAPRIVATGPPPIAAASTWLLREGWRRAGGVIPEDAAPADPSSRPARAVP